MGEQVAVVVFVIVVIYLQSCCCCFFFLQFCCCCQKFLNFFSSVGIIYTKVKVRKRKRKKEKREKKRKKKQLQMQLKLQHNGKQHSNTLRVELKNWLIKRPLYNVYLDEERRLKKKTGEREKKDKKNRQKQ